MSSRRLSIENSDPGAMDICSARAAGMSDPAEADDNAMLFTSTGTICFEMFVIVVRLTAIVLSPWYLL